MVLSTSCALVLPNASLLHLDVGGDACEGSAAMGILLLQFQTLCHHTSYVDTAVSCLQLWEGEREKMRREKMKKWRERR